MFISLVPHYYKLFAITDTKSPPKGVHSDGSQPLGEKYKEEFMVLLLIAKW